jgi:hypothetical protein
MRWLPVNHNADPNRLSANEPISHGAEQEHLSSTDKEDLDAAVHNANIPVEEETQDEEIIYDDDVPQKYTEAYGTGVKNQQV